MRPRRPAPRPPDPGARTVWKVRPLLDDLRQRGPAPFRLFVRALKLHSHRRRLASVATRSAAGHVRWRRPGRDARRRRLARRTRVAQHGVDVEPETNGAETGEKRDGAKQAEKQAAKTGGTETATQVPRSGPARKDQIPAGEDPPRADPTSDVTRRWHCEDILARKTPRGRNVGDTEPMRNVQPTERSLIQPSRGHCRPGRPRRRRLASSQVRH